MSIVKAPAWMLILPRRAATSDVPPISPSKAFSFSV